MIRVSFQGERGAYSEAVALVFFNEKIETIPLLTFANVLENTENDKSEYSILPVENSIEGSVGESNDLLYTTTLNVIGEIYHKIQHFFNFWISFISLKIYIEIVFPRSIFFRS